MFKRKCKITFIRHGSTIYSDENRLCDKLNYPPLNEVGKIEASNIAQWVEKRSPKVDKIYTSPDVKSMQTCEFVAKEYKKDFQIIDNLYSRRSGEWNGLTFDQIEKQYPEEIKKYHQDRANFWCNGGETIADFSIRVRNAISELIEKNKGKRIIIVTNGDVIQAEICNALGIPLQNIGQIYIPCGSATQLSYFTEWTSLVYSAHVPV